MIKEYQIWKKERFIHFRSVDPGGEGETEKHKQLRSREGKMFAHLQRSINKKQIKLFAIE